MQKKEITHQFRHADHQACELCVAQRLDDSSSFTLFNQIKWDDTDV